MPFNVSWHTLLDELEELPDGATLIDPPAAFAHCILHTRMTTTLIWKYLDQSVHITTEWFLHRNVGKANIA